MTKKWPFLIFFKKIFKMPYFLVNSILFHLIMKIGFFQIITCPVIRWTNYWGLRPLPHPCNLPTLTLGPSVGTFHILACLVFRLLYKYPMQWKLMILGIMKNLTAFKLRWGIIFFIHTKASKIPSDLIGWLQQKITLWQAWWSSLGKKIWMKQKNI